MSDAKPTQQSARDSSPSTPAGINTASLVTRSITALGYGLTVLVCVWFSAWSTAILFGIMAALATTEFITFTHSRNRLPSDRMAILAAALFPVAVAAWNLTGAIYVITALLIAVLALHVVFERTRTADLASSIFAPVYTGFLLSYLVSLRQLGGPALGTWTIGAKLALALVLSVWANDVFAYLVGSLIGRHKMAPRISPKKSWEGFIAGLVGCMAVWAGLTLVPGVGLTLPLALSTGLCVGVVSVVGDLAESRLKRQAGVKDSGTLLPGHGGFLDRLDSLILASMAAYWILTWSGIR